MSFFIVMFNAMLTLTIIANKCKVIGANFSIPRDES